MATGDLKNSLRQLQAELKAIKFPQPLDIEQCVSGAPALYLGIYHYLFTNYNGKLNKDIANSNNELYSKSDKRFMEAMYKILRDFFQYKPQITREQFFTTSFAERKAIMARDVVRLVHAKYGPARSSSGYKVDSSRVQKKINHCAKVHQEPPDHQPEPLPRKTASRSSRDVSGAVILPSGSVHIAQDVGTGVSEQPSSQPIPESYLRQMEADMCKQVTDAFSPALAVIRDRMNHIECAIENVEQKPPSQPSPPPVDTTELSGQMKEVMYQLDTLTSQMVLLDNRLTLVEAKLEDSMSQPARQTQLEDRVPQPASHPLVEDRVPQAASHPLASVQSDRHEPNMHFIKSLVSGQDESVTLQDSMTGPDASRTESPPPPPPHCGLGMSPIQSVLPRVDCPSPEVTYRRSSTPTHKALDMSTLDRIERINQMMAETHQLFH